MRNTRRSLNASGSTTTAGSAVRVAMRLSAEVLMTLGVLLALFVVYHLWWTGMVAAQAADDVRQELEQSWELAPPRPTLDPDSTPSPTPVPTPVSVVSVAAGEAFGMVYIPALKSKVWGLPLLNGIDDTSLSRGIGYFPGTAPPGEVGNFAIAGHRATNGEPLRDIDQLQDGDLVVVRTQQAWFTYRLERDLIVQPTDIWVIEPNPFAREGAEPNRWLTIVTCHPRWGSEQRWIWWGALLDVRTSEEGPPPALGDL